MAAPRNQLVQTGTIMIAARTFLIGFQLVLSFLNYDISASPREPLHPFLKGWQPKAIENEQAPTREEEAEQVRREA